MDTMRRLARVVLPAAVLAACVSVAPVPDPHGVYKAGQRLVVMMYQSPGPWIVSDTGSKLGSAAEISPFGFAVEALHDRRTLSVSKDLQQYLPRPPYAVDAQAALLAELRTILSSAAVQTALEVGVPPEQIQGWNRARDQLDWRSRYFSPDPDSPAPRDYSKVAGLGDALVLDVNLSFGTTATESGALQPLLSASWRVYRGEDGRKVWEHVEEVVDHTSSSTLVDIQTTPADFTARLASLAPALGKAVAREFIRAFAVAPLSAPPAAPTAGGGLLSMDFLKSLSSSTASGAPPGVAAATATPVAVSTAAAAFISVSTAPASR